MTMRSRSFSSRWLVLPALAALASPACSSSVDTGTGGAGGSPATSTGNASGGAGGDQTTSTSAGGAGGENTGGAGGAIGCQSDADCTNDPNGTICNVDTGECVGCLVDNDLCIQGQYCEPSVQQCTVGCTDDTDCEAGGDLVCDVATHQCVGCTIDTDCPGGSICSGVNCVPGCSGTQSCQVGFSCCNAICYDLAVDENHCGDCATICEALPQAEALCAVGLCDLGPCVAPYADCNGDENGAACASDADCEANEVCSNGSCADGCEQNTLQDGSCVCTPGDVQSCYQGEPNTAGVGPCQEGSQTCAPSGLGWGPCIGQILPAYEVCNNGVDEDCDGSVDNGSDTDGDGWTYCDGDCCDAQGPGCGSPNLVNPGAYEFVGNDVDDDCNPATSDVVPAPPCSVAEKFAGVTGMDVAAAMELCLPAVANPPLPERTWGLISATQLLANGNVPSATALSNMQNNQTAILVNYGTGGVVPQVGATMAGISSGKMRDQTDVGYAGTATGYASNSAPPAAYLAAHAGNLPSSAGCSGNCPSGTGANDSTNVRLTVRVPTNAQSLSYQFRFFSSEYWTYSCTQFNDFYLALLQSAAPGIPPDQNISFDGAGNPVSVNNGFFDVCAPKGCYTCPAGVGPLAGTGMQLGNTGGATNWLTTDAPIVPGETIQIEFMVFDVSDTTLDSLTLLDNFTWSILPATVGTHE